MRRIPTTYLRPGDVLSSGLKVKSVSPMEASKRYSVKFYGHPLDSEQYARADDYWRVMDEEDISYKENVNRLAMAYKDFQDIKDLEEEIKTLKKRKKKIQKRLKAVSTKLKETTS